MTFNDTTTKDGLIQFCEDFLFNKYGVISGDQELLFSFTNKLNRGLDKTISLLFSSDNKWQFDDSNYTDYPIATTDIQTGQKDYTLQISPEMLIIERVEMTDSSGNWTVLQPFDLNQTYTARDYLSGTTQGGTPYMYDKLDMAIMLYPTPNYSYNQGLRVYFKRNPSYFTSADTTKSPGFAKIYHDLVALYACSDYALINEMTGKYDRLQVAIEKKENEVKSFYVDRDRDQRTVIRPYVTAWRNE